MFQPAEEYKAEHSKRMQVPTDFLNVLFRRTRKFSSNDSKDLNCRHIFFKMTSAIRKILHKKKETVRKIRELHISGFFGFVVKDEILFSQNEDKNLKDVTLYRIFQTEFFSIFSRFFCKILE